MATIQNDRDKLLQAAAVRFIPPVIPPSQVEGLPGWMGDVEDALDALDQDVEHLMNTSAAFSIRASDLVFTNTSGTTTPATITLTAVRGEGLTGGTVTWSEFAGSATLSPLTGESTTVTGSSVSGRSVTIRARLTISGVNHDAYVTITRLGAIAASNVVNLTSQVTGQLAMGNVTGYGALALLNTVNLNTQTTGALNGLTQVTNLGNLAYANAVAANQIGAGTLAAGVIYAGNINASQVQAGSFVGKSFTGGTFNGSLITGSIIESSRFEGELVASEEIDSDYARIVDLLVVNNIQTPSITVVPKASAPPGFNGKVEYIAGSLCFYSAGQWWRCLAEPL